MESKATRSVFVASLCAGVAMIGVSVNGVLGVDAELQRSAFAAQQRTVDQRTVEELNSVHIFRNVECPAPAPRSKQRI